MLKGRQTKHGCVRYYVNKGYRPGVDWPVGLVVRFVVLEPLIAKPETRTNICVMSMNICSVSGCNLSIYVYI